MSADELGEAPIEVERRILVSGSAAARIAGVNRKTWPAIAAQHKIEPVSTGRRLLWRRLDVEALIRGNA
jgi:hypothetical protein